VLYLVGGRAGRSEGGHFWSPVQRFSFRKPHILRMLVASQIEPQPNPLGAGKEVQTMGTNWAREQTEQ
jgi:hypothetical protein